MASVKGSWAQLGVMVTGISSVTAVVVIVKAAVVLPAVTVAVAVGTLALLLVKVTTVSVAAAWANTIVPVIDCPPVIGCG